MSGSFVRIVSEAMEQKKISLRRIAKDAGLDPSFFSKVLAGKRSAPSDQKVLRRLAQLLEIDPVLLIVSTGTIPLELQGLLENLDFLRSLQGLPAGADLSVSLRPKAVSTRATIKPAASRKREPLRVIRASPDLPEDLL